jgi:type I phosphodiesterase/nucleotide pyrophosphatase
MALVLALGALALGSMRAALVSVAELNRDGPVFVPPPDPAPRAVTPAHRVMAIVVDGLRADMARRLPFLSRLAKNGAAADMQVEMPTYSAAEYVAMLTGVIPRDSGIRANVGLHLTPLDSVPARVRLHGGRAVEIGDEVDWWRELYGTAFDPALLVAPRELLARAIAEMPATDFLLVHLTAVDYAGHHHGAASREYREAAAASDRTAEALARAWGWPDATVVALADHGHTWPRGGHGGDEPDVRTSWLFASGPGVAPGARVSTARVIDVAPTLAALLGVPSPAQAQGRTLGEILDVGAPVRAELAAADEARHARVAPAVAAGEARAAAEERQQQLVRLAALVLCLGLAGVVVKRASARERLGLLIGLAATAAAAAGYLIVYRRVSFSADRDCSTLAENTVRIAAAAAAAVFLPPLVSVVRGRLRCTEASRMAFLAVAGASPLALATFAWAGAFTPRFTVEPAWLAAAPLLVYAAFAPVVLAATALTSFGVAAEMMRRRAASLSSVPVAVAVPAVPAVPGPGTPESGSPRRRAATA